MQEEYSKRFSRIRFLFKPFLIGIAVLIAAHGYYDFSEGENIKGLGLLLIIPFCFYTPFTIILHWKDFYEGNNKELWLLAFIFTNGVGFLAYYIWHLGPHMSKENDQKEKSISTRST